MNEPLRVLLVEDSEDDAELLLARLHSGGYAVTSERVETAPAMRAALARQDWDLVLSDHAMPQFSATAALALLKDAGADTPFIIVSSEISQKVAVEAMRAGARDYVYKGDLARLLPAIERELREAAARRERRRAETQVQFQARLLDMVEQAVVATDVEGKITYWNRHAKNLFGQATERVESSAAGFAASESRQPQWAELGASLGRAESWSGEVELPGRGGSSFPALVTTSPIYGDQGQVSGAVHIIADLTERKKAEEALRREAAKVEILREVDQLRSDLIANVSHELRTPLGLILVFCTTLLSQDAQFDPAIHQEFLHNIEEEARRLQHIVDELLDSSRLQRGRVLLDRRTLALPALVQSTLAKLAPQVAQHPVRVELPQTRLVALGDSRAVEQVLRNLISNAVKYSPPASSIVVRGQAGDRYAEISVHDEGYGISAEDLPHIFERFYRANNELTRQVAGIGLGLSICRELVEAQGGQIWVESVIGQGSTFHFTLPMPETPASQDESTGSYSDE
jgi:PAS domain S-box-containing protein